MHKEVDSIKNGYIAKTIHRMEKTEQACRLIVIRRPYQSTLFAAEDATLKNRVISTNRIDPLEHVVRRYNQRRECSQNRIKELKIGFGMELMPCGQLNANAMFFRIGTMPYNIFRLFTLKVLSLPWHQNQAPLGST